MQKRQNKPMGSLDFTLLLTIIILLIIGTIMVFSASWPEALSKYDNQYQFLRKHIVFLILGMFAMFFFSYFNYNNLRKLAFPVFVITVFLCALVALTPLGIEHNGAVRWLKIGIEFMPADMVKVSSIIFFASFLANKKADMLTLTKGTIPALIVIGVSIIFIIKNDLGTSMIIVGTLGVMFFIGGINIIHALILLPAGVYAVIAYAKRKKFRMTRLLTFLDPFSEYYGAGWQVIQSLYAISTGGLFGVGLGQSRQKFFYLSEAYNDFIFAIIAEELGAIGCVIVISLYLVLVYRGVTIAVRTKDLYGRYLAIGLTGLIAVQSLIHIGVVTSSIPTTGVTLPFISYGGTSLIITMCAMGILLNISRYVDLG